MRVLQTVLTGPDECHYLPERQATMENLVVAQLSPEEYEQKMNEGWRKFGPVLFRPICDGCRECRPIRILAAEFSPSRSQRRALAKNADLEVRHARPTVDVARLALYNRYHTAQEVAKGWPEVEKSAEDYAFSFVHNPLPAVEISVWEEGVLRAVVLTDITPNTVSGVYHYYEPECEGRSIGTFAMLQTIALARLLEKPWAYFGYWVAACPSLSYKSKFNPCEIINPQGQWEPNNP
ncbi:arginyltransferase [Armatimonas sp.]|uniref:arginyltransferase n=1 Tax=Armatimonas sp. TaxID=1872638 RepID=UPI00286A4818|nr:arginyltransferase [Armatimonas sp.]